MPLRGVHTEMREFPGLLFANRPKVAVHWTDWDSDSVTEPGSAQHVSSQPTPPQPQSPSRDAQRMPEEPAQQEPRQGGPRAATPQRGAPDHQVPDTEPRPQAAPAAGPRALGNPPTPPRLEPSDSDAGDANSNRAAIDPCSDTEGDPATERVGCDSGCPQRDAPAAPTQQQQQVGTGSGTRAHHPSPAAAPAALRAQSAPAPRRARGSGGGSRPGGPPRAAGAGGHQPHRTARPAAPAAAAAATAAALAGLRAAAVAVAVQRRWDRRIAQHRAAYMRRRRRLYVVGLALFMRTFQEFHIMKDLKALHAEARAALAAAGRRAAQRAEAARRIPDRPRRPGEKRVRMSTPPRNAAGQIHGPCLRFRTPDAACAAPPPLPRPENSGPPPGQRAATPPPRSAQTPPAEVIWYKEVRPSSEAERQAALLQRQDRIASCGKPSKRRRTAPAPGDSRHLPKEESHSPPCPAEPAGRAAPPMGHPQWRYQRGPWSTDGGGCTEGAVPQPAWPAALSAAPAEGAEWSQAGAPGGSAPSLCPPRDTGLPPTVRPPPIRTWQQQQPQQASPHPPPPPPPPGTRAAPPAASAAPAGPAAAAASPAAAPAPPAPGGTE
eukprot:TRINITY_DN1214_c0_g2_i3.p1 TRINITY_DN1214_c0_g2~~TRINITY_DN1214_c0_g2_i3.p1  ORF type:complete len:605 (+),score=105.63 TRINITY_DN1214_c0_g2_i3:118-1932(+)